MKVVAIVGDEPIQRALAAKIHDAAPLTHVARVRIKLRLGRAAGGFPHHVEQPLDGLAECDEPPRQVEPLRIGSHRGAGRGSSRRRIGGEAG